MNSKATPSPAIEGDMVNVEDFGAAKAAVRADKTTKPSVFIDQLTFSDGQKINLKQNDIVVFVGPNNSGKSLALREINASLARADHKGLVITGLTYQRVGTESDLIKWLESTSTINNAREGNPTYQGFEYGFKRGLVEDRWKPEATGLTELARFFVR
jgi:ATPase subunit of ABC transporter with duplicated ATPase domains